MDIQVRVVGIGPESELIIFNNDLDESWGNANLICRQHKIEWEIQYLSLFHGWVSWVVSSAPDTTIQEGFSQKEASSENVSEDDQGSGNWDLQEENEEMIYFNLRRKDWAGNRAAFFGRTWKDITEKKHRRLSKVGYWINTTKSAMKSTIKRLKFVTVYIPMDKN